MSFIESIARKYNGKVTTKKSVDAITGSLDEIMGMMTSFTQRQRGWMMAKNLSDGGTHTIKYKSSEKAVALIISLETKDGVVVERVLTIDVEGDVVTFTFERNVTVEYLVNSIHFIDELLREVVNMTVADIDKELGL